MKKTKNRSKEIIEEAKEQRCRNASKAFVGGEPLKDFYDVEINVKSETEKLFSIKRDNINIFDLKYLVENIEEIKKKADMGDIEPEFLPPKEKWEAIK